MVIPYDVTYAIFIRVLRRCEDASCRRKKRASFFGGEFSFFQSKALPTNAFRPAYTRENDISRPVFEKRALRAHHSRFGTPSCPLRSIVSFLKRRVESDRSPHFFIRGKIGGVLNFNQMWSRARFFNQMWSFAQFFNQMWSRAQFFNQMWSLLLVFLTECGHH